MKAKLNYLRIAPRKTRLVADLIRGMGVSEAKKQLIFSLKKSAQPILKLLDSALNNAKKNFNKEKIEDLYISEIMVNEGPSLKRSMPRAFGRAAEIRKRTSHIEIVLKEREEKKDVKKIVKKKAVQIKK